MYNFLFSPLLYTLVVPSFVHFTGRCSTASRTTRTGTTFSVSSLLSAACSQPCLVRARAGLGLGLGLGLGRGGYDARVHRDAEHASVAAAARELCGEGEARQLGRAVPSVRAYGRQAARIGIHMPHV